MIKLPTFPAAFPAAFPAIDFSGLDASRLADTNEKLVAAVRDTAYVTVGFGVLALQQAQVRRRELVRNIDARVVALETRIDATVEKLEERLPQQAAAVVGQAHDLVKAARKQVRSLVTTAA